MLLDFYFSKSKIKFGLVLQLRLQELYCCCLHLQIIKCMIYGFSFLKSHSVYNIHLINVNERINFLQYEKSKPIGKPQTQMVVYVTCAWFLPVSAQLNQAMHGQCFVSLPEAQQLNIVGLMAVHRASLPYKNKILRKKH